jgi:hypothetical protein
MPPQYGKHMERKIINAVFERLLPEDRIQLCDTTKRSRTNLEKAIQATRAHHNMLAASTIRAWIDHYILWGETPAETREREAKIGRRKQSKWTPRINRLLRYIITNHPELYLDEIQRQLLLLSECLFNTSTIYRHMKRMGFSRKVVYEKSAQRDEEERAAWRTFILDRGPDVANHLVFIDETHKSIKAMRRRRHWVYRGREQPFCVNPFYGNDRDIRYSMIVACDQNGFVQEACEVIKTTGSGDDVGQLIGKGLKFGWSKSWFLF